MTIRRFENLEIWKEGMRLAEKVYLLFAKSPELGFRDQICRSSLSVPSNIAEGFERGSDKKFIRFLRIVISNNAELEHNCIWLNV